VNVFGEKVNQGEFNEVKFEALVREYKKNMILLSINNTAMSVKEIADVTSMMPREHM